MKLRESVPEAERVRIPRWLPGRGLTTNAMDATRLKDSELAENAAAWAEKAFAAWAATGRTGEPPSNDVLAAQEALGIESKVSIADLINYRASYTSIPAAKLKGGARMGYLSNKGTLNQFPFPASDSIERLAFLEIARAYGGDFLALWTFGHAVHVELIRNEKPGGTPVEYGPASLRILPPAGGRSRTLLTDLRSWFNLSSFQPDWARIEEQWAAPEIRPAQWFAAFGVTGALDFDSPDAAQLWQDFENTAVALLSGEGPDKSAIRRLNAVIEVNSPDDTLKNKGAKPGKGENARKVFNAAYALQETLGRASSGRWKERYQAASFYWDITDGPAGELLTAGTDKKGFGEAASLARLLSHYPPELLRDSIFLSLAAQQCEAANGHVYVNSLERLAEGARTAELAAVVLRSSLAKFRKAFGISGQEVEASEQPGEWAGEAFVHSSYICKPELIPALREWFARQKESGAVVYLKADGTCALNYFQKGETVPGSSELWGASPDLTALGSAGQLLSPRAVFPALGVGDLLAPGKWSPGIHGGNAEGGAPAPHVLAKRRIADERIAVAPPAAAVTDLSSLWTTLGTVIRHRGDVPETEGGFVTLRIELPGASAEYVRALKNDLRGEQMVNGYGDVWGTESRIHAYTCAGLETALLISVLGDCPNGSKLFVAAGEVLVHLIVERE